MKRSLKGFLGSWVVVGTFLSAVWAEENRQMTLNPPGETVERGPSNAETAAEKGLGSLWSADDHRGFLFEDLKARRVGDIVTVRIVENSRGTKNASTKTEKDSTLTSSVGALFGLSANKLSVDTETSESFDGSGSTSRSSQLTAMVTARVMEVLPNGNLVIDGKREVVVNKERQFILLSGIVRQEDIGSNNVVLSSQIADANISYTGSGVINDKQRPGWFVRIFDFIWPF